MSTLERAIAIAAAAHEGATDKGGQPYILHPLRVMSAVGSADERIAAVLHDVVEDTDWTVDRLRREGFSETVLEALRALTRHPGEDYLAYVRRAGADPVARQVKLADLADNMDRSRLPSQTARDRARLERYATALAMLEGRGPRPPGRAPSSAEPERTASARGYTVLPYPSERQVVLDAMAVGRRKYMMHGFYEADVTRARQILQARELSLTAFIVACAARAAARNRRVHAYRDWRSRLIAFDDVDVTVLVEAQAGGTSFPLAHLVRAANRRPVEEISREIRAVQRSPWSSPSGRLLRWGRVYPWIPGVLRRLAIRALLANPRRLQRAVGTACVTSVGMFAGGGGFGLSVPTVHNFCVVVGGIVERPAIVAGELVAREAVQLTLSFNHAVVDGAPAARAARELRQAIESAELLDEPEGGDATTAQS